MQPFAGGLEHDDTSIEAAGRLASDPETLVGQKHFAEVAQAAVAVLGPEVRLVVTLFLVEGLPYNDIAKIADCPIGTVVSRLARGRRLLQHLLRVHRDGTRLKPITPRPVKCYQS